MSKKNVKFPKVRTELRVRESESREIRKKIQASTGMDRWHAWVEKRSYGEDTRHLLLAYGYLRGRPYGTCEKKCGDLNFPSSSYIARLATEYGVQTSAETIDVWIAVRGGPEALDKAFAELPAPAPAPEPPPVAPASEARPGFFAKLFGKAS
jgi:hypothetical protein